MAEKLARVSMACHCNTTFYTLHEVVNVLFQTSIQEYVSEKLFSYFSTETYVVGTQTNRLIETVLLSTENTRSN